MMAWLARRLGWSLLVMWIVVSGSFALAFVLPADPARLIAGAHASPEVIERVRADKGLDQPMITQYGRFVAGVAKGDLGRSYRTEEPVTAALARAIPWTALIALGASLFQLAVGVPLGVLAAVRRDTWVDRAVNAAALTTFSAPTYVLGLGLMILLGFQAGLFPLGGTGEGAWGVLRSAVLPSLTLGLAGSAYYTQLARTETIEASAQDYVRTATAKGLSGPRVVVGHVLPNALIPVVAFFGLDLGAMLGGAVVTEAIFAWPGVGRLAVDSVMNQDVPLLLGTVLFASAAVVVANLVVDVVIAWLDPRIRR